MFVHFVIVNYILTVLISHCMSHNLNNIINIFNVDNSLVILLIIHT